MTGLLSPAPASSQEQAQSVYLVSNLSTSNILGIGSYGAFSLLLVTVYVWVAS